MDGTCFLPEGGITMLWLLSWDGQNGRNMFPTWRRYNHALAVVMNRSQRTEHVFLPEDGITMLRPWSWDDHNGWNMFPTWRRYNQALTVVMNRWQLLERVSYLRDILPCSGRYHVKITTVGACFIPKGYITMLWLLSCDDDNCRSMFHT